MMGVSKWRHITPIELIVRKTELVSKCLYNMADKIQNWMSDQRLSSDNRMMLLYSKQQRIGNK